MAQALLGGLTGVGAPPTAASLQSGGLSKVQQFFKEGVPVNWLGLFVLAGGIPYAPFSFLGYTGLNLLVVGATAWGMAKAAAQGASTLAKRYIEAYYPSLWWIAAALTFNPWYIFDLVQLMSPTFRQDGFKLPFTQRKLGGVGATGKMMPAHIAVAMGVVSAGLYSLVDSLPPEIVSRGKPLMKTIFTVIGSGSLLAGGGMGAIAAAPEIFKALQSNLTEVATTPAAPGPAPVAPPAPVAAAVPQPQKGGAAAPGAIPSLQSIADAMLGPAPYGDPAPVEWQRGGGRGPRGPKSDEPSSSSAQLFLLILSVITLGGMSLAVARTKGAPAP